MSRRKSTVQRRVGFSTFYDRERSLHCGWPLERRPVQVQLRKPQIVRPIRKEAETKALLTEEG